MTPEDFTAWRVRIGFTKEAAAKRFGQSRFTIQNWESGASAMPFFVDEVARMIEREVRQAKDDFPVRLAYTKTDLWSDGGMNYVQVEEFPRNSLMLRRVKELVGAGTFYLATAVDQKNPDIVIWHHEELVKEVSNPRTAPVVEAMFPRGGTMIIQHRCELFGRPWRFNLSIERDRWEDVFDDNHAETAYRRDVGFWNWLAISAAEPAKNLATPDAVNRTIPLDPPKGDLKQMHTNYRRDRGI